MKYAIALIVLLPLFIKWHKAGVERYRRYDRLAFYNSLSSDDQESLDWYAE